MRNWIRITFLSALSLCAAGARAHANDLPGKRDYLDNCARCHGVDGKGSVPATRATRGYVEVDLTQLSSANDGNFPRHEVYEAIDGRKRLPGHMVGGMPAWGLKFQPPGAHAPAEEKALSAKIETLTDYIESLQQP